MVENATVMCYNGANVISRGEMFVIRRFQEFMSGITVCYKYLQRIKNYQMTELGLKGIHARLFMAICRTPGCSQDQLAKRLWSDKSTITRQMELLESKGYVTRIPSQTDKRMLCVPRCPEYCRRQFCLYKYCSSR